MNRPCVVSSRMYLRAMGIVLLLIFSVHHARADAAVDRYFKLYASGQFDAAFAAFDKAIQSQDQSINKENLLEMLESLFGQLDHPTSSMLRAKLTVAAKAKMLFFVKKRVRATLKAIDLFDANKNQDLAGLHSVLEKLVALPGGGLTYPHDKFAQLRVIRMVLNHRRFKGLAQPGDFYLNAMIDHSISKDGRSELANYFKHADKTDPFYQAALALKAKH